MYIRSIIGLTAVTPYLIAASLAVSACSPKSRPRGKPTVAAGTVFEKLNGEKNKTTPEQLPTLQDPAIPQETREEATADLNEILDRNKKAADPKTKEDDKNTKTLVQKLDAINTKFDDAGVNISTDASGKMILTVTTKTENVFTGEISKGAFSPIASDATDTANLTAKCYSVSCDLLMIKIKDGDVETAMLVRSLVAEWAVSKDSQEILKSEDKNIKALNEVVGQSVRITSRTIDKTDANDVDVIFDIEQNGKGFTLVGSQALFKDDNADSASTSLSLVAGSATSDILVTGAEYTVSRDTKSSLVTKETLKLASLDSTGAAADIMLETPIPVEKPEEAPAKSEEEKVNPPVAGDEKSSDTPAPIVQGDGQSGAAPVSTDNTDEQQADESSSEDDDSVAPVPESV